MRARFGGILLAALASTVTYAGCAAIDGLDCLEFDPPADAGGADALHEDARDADMDARAADMDAGDADVCIPSNKHGCWP
jgi:hypothetical protein